VRVWINIHKKEQKRDQRKTPISEKKRKSKGTRPRKKKIIDWEAEGVRRRKAEIGE